MSIWSLELTLLSPLAFSFSDGADVPLLAKGIHRDKQRQKEKNYSSRKHSEKEFTSKVQGIPV